MKKLLNFVHYCIALSIVVFCSTVHGAEIPKDYSQKATNPPSKPVEINNQLVTPVTLLHILEHMSESLIENLFKSAKGEMEWSRNLLYSYDPEHRGHILFYMSHESPVGIDEDEGRLFFNLVRKYNKCYPNNINANIFTSVKEVIRHIEELLKIEDKVLFILESYNIVTGVKHSVESQELNAWK